MSFSQRFPALKRPEEDVVQAIGLDIHLDFCEVAISEDGEVRSAGRISTTPEQVELFASSLGRDDRVALEVTGNAWEIARLIEPNVARVVVVNAKRPRAISEAKAKTDRLDARRLAELLASGYVAGVWCPDDGTRALGRWVARRAQLVRQCSRAICLLIVGAASVPSAPAQRRPSGNIAR
jgi:transposase